MLDSTVQYSTVIDWTVQYSDVLDTKSKYEINSCNYGWPGRARAQYPAIASQNKICSSCPPPIHEKSLAQSFMHGASKLFPRFLEQPPPTNQLPDYLNMFLYWNKLGAESFCCYQLLVIASDKYFKILQGTIKMGCKEEIRTFCPFCLTDGFCPHLMVENMPPRKIQNIFTVNVFFSFMISEGWPCGDWGYEKIKSSKEKKSVGLIFSFSVKYFLFKLDPSPLMPYLFIKFCKMWNVFNQISPATYHLSAFDSFFGAFFLLGNFYFLCRNVSVKPEFNEKSLQK